MPAAQPLRAGVRCPVQPGKGCLQSSHRKSRRAKLTLPPPQSQALRFTPEQVKLCAANPDAVLELSAGG